MNTTLSTVMDAFRYIQMLILECKKYDIYRYYRSWMVNTYSIQAPSLETIYKCFIIGSSTFRCICRYKKNYHFLEICIWFPKLPVYRLCMYHIQHNKIHVQKYPYILSWFNNLIYLRFIFSVICDILLQESKLNNQYFKTIVSYYR